MTADPAPVTMRVAFSAWGVDHYCYAGEVIAVPAAFVTIFEESGFAVSVAVTAAGGRTAGARRSPPRTRSRPRE